MTANIDTATLIDKLCERWMVERIAVELYDHALGHARRVETRAGVETRLEDFRREEADHQALVEEVLRRLGAEPRVDSAGAVAAHREAEGLLDVCRRPDAALPHVLHALLTAESADKAGWELLVELAQQAGLEAEQVARMKAAALREQAHVAWVRLQLDELARQELRGAHPGF